MKNGWLRLAALAARWLPGDAKRAIYRVRPLAGWIRRRLNRSAPAGVARTQVAAGALVGAQLWLDLRREKDYWLGTYEPDLQAAICDWVKPGMTAYDVGANIGYIALTLARRVGTGGQVFAFEALPANVDRLKTNLALNPEGARVQVQACAVLDRCAPVRFWIGPSHGMGKAEGSAGRPAGETAYTAAIEVDGISLDDFVYRQGNPPPQAVKIDVEGGEVMVLPGMRRLLAEARPLLLMEIHGPQAARAAWEQLSAAGYSLCAMRPGYPAVASPEALGWKAYLVAHPKP